MAQSAVTTMEEFSKMFLKCHKCNDEFKDENKHARLLPCLHSLCFECLNETKVHDQLQCPTCEANYFVNDVDKDCPRDNIRRDLIDFVKVKQATTTIQCSICPPSYASYRCKQCAQFLCSECKTRHSRVSATKSHTLIEITKLRQTLDLNDFCQQVNCNDHPENQLVMYCTNGTCQKPVCVSCAACINANESLDSVATAKRELITKQKLPLKDVGTQLQQVINDVISEQEKVLHLEKTEEEIITKTFDELEQIISTRHGDLKKTLKCNASLKLDYLKAQEKQLTNRKCSIEESSKFTNQVLAHTNSQTFLQVFQTIHNRLKTLTESFFDKEPHEMATFGFHGKEIISEIQTDVEEMAKTWSISAFPPNCRINIGEELEENKSEMFSVKLLDCENNTPFQEIGLDITYMKIIVRDPSGKEIECERKLKTGSTDELEVTVKPTMTGRHTLEVRVLDRVVVSKYFESKPAKVEERSDDSGSSLVVPDTDSESHDSTAAFNSARRPGSTPTPAQILANDSTAAFNSARRPGSTPTPAQILAKDSTTAVISAHRPGSTPTTAQRGTLNDSTAAFNSARRPGSTPTPAQILARFGRQRQPEPERLKKGRMQENARKEAMRRAGSYSNLWFVNDNKKGSS